MAANFLVGREAQCQGHVWEPAAGRVSPPSLGSWALGRWVIFSCTRSPCASWGRTWMSQWPLHLQWHRLFSAHPGRLWAALLLRWTALHLQMCKDTGKPCSCVCGCSAHTTLPGAGVIHSAATLLCRNTVLHFNSLSSKYSLSGTRWGEECSSASCHHPSGWKPGQLLGLRAAAPQGTALFSCRWPSQGEVLVGISELHTAD